MKQTFDFFISFYYIPNLGLDDVKNLQFILVQLLKAGGIQSTVAIYIPLGMTNFFQSVSQVDNNIIKSQEKVTKKAFLYSQEKKKNFAII